MSNQPTAPRLSPCPHCGCRDVAYSSGWRFSDRRRDDALSRMPAVVCLSCSIAMHIGVLGRGVPDADAERMTAEHWNRRAPCLESAALVDAGVAL